MRFSGKVAGVTGAAGGIGSAICARLAQEGAAVLVTDVDAEGAEATAGAIREAGGTARAVVEDVLGQEGRIDVL